MNNIIYGIILYVIIITTLVFTKPSFIYDHNKNRYKEFGSDVDKTIFTLPTISIFLAILIAICFSLCLSKKENVEKNKNVNNYPQHIQYIPIPYYQNYQNYPNNFVYDPRMIRMMSNNSGLSSGVSSSLSPTLTTHTQNVINSQISHT